MARARGRPRYRTPCHIWPPVPVADLFGLLGEVLDCAGPHGGGRFLPVVHKLSGEYLQLVHLLYEVEQLVLVSHHHWLMGCRWWFRLSMQLKKFGLGEGGTMREHASASTWLAREGKM